MIVRLFSRASLRVASPLVLLPLLAGLASCSSKEDPAPAASGGVADSGVKDTAPRPDMGPVYPEITCGPGPYVTWPLDLLVGQTLGAASKTPPQQQLKLSLSACPELKAMTDVEGYAILRVTVGQPLSIKFEGQGWIPTRWYEVTPQAWSEKPFLSLTAEAARPTLEGLAEGMILLDIGGAAVGTCTSPLGVAVAVEGYPDAKIAYRGPSSPFAPVAGATASSSSGIVTISGIPSGTKVKLVATKTDCEVVSLGSPGEVLVEAGVVSRVQMVVRDPLPACGPAPWVLLGGKVSDRLEAGTLGEPLLGASVSWNECPGAVATTNAEGAWRAWVSQNMPATRKTSFADYISTIISEQYWPQDYEELGVGLRKDAVWRPLLPGFTDTEGFLGVLIAGNDAGACKGDEGVALQIKDQPTAKITYMNGDPPMPTTGKVTTTRGLAYISGVKPGVLELGSVTGTREGCTYGMKGSVDTGRTRVEAGGYSAVTLYPKKVQ